MSRLRYNRRQAVSHLSRSCDRLAAFIERQGRFGLKVQRDHDLFNALSRAIIYQQLSGKAAGTIHGRFCAMFPNGNPDAGFSDALTMEQLRSVGLSRNKALAVQDLAQRTMDGSLPSMRRAAGMNDEDLVETLCQVRGIGPWTAQMLLIFTLGRPDVMPATDLGVQKGVQQVYALEALPSPEEVISATLHLAPYRSAATWYFWRAADTVLMT